MVLAAGLGTRMRPLTDSMPKPLIKVAGSALIDRGLDRLAAAGVKKAVVNVHYLAGQVDAHVRHRTAPNVVISDERAQLLETGGGLAKALPLLGPDPFFLLNSDSFFTEHGCDNLGRLAAAFDPAVMDLILLLADPHTSIGYDGAGDFHVDPAGRLARRGSGPGPALVYTGTAIIHPRLFEGAPEGAFSLNILFDQAIGEGRLFGLPLDGTWFHIGTPAAIEEAEAVLSRLVA